jgi:hypothetical protein
MSEAGGVLPWGSQTLPTAQPSSAETIAMLAIEACAGTRT